MRLGWLFGWLFRCRSSLDFRSRDGEGGMSICERGVLGGRRTAAASAGVSAGRLSWLNGPAG